MNAPKCDELDHIRFLVAMQRVFSNTEAPRCHPEAGNGGPAHDAYTRLLHRCQSDGDALWQQVQGCVSREEEMLILDDSTLDKFYARVMDMVTRHWSGKHRRVVQGINLISLLWTDGMACLPCDFRIYDKAHDQLSKNDHFRAMVDTAAPAAGDPGAAAGGGGGADVAHDDRAEELLDSGEVVEAEVTDHNRGGVLVRFGRIQGFVPNSQLTSLSRWASDEERTKAKAELVGQALKVVVLEVTRRPGRGRLVLSERAANRQQRRAFYESLSEGQVLTGTVRSLKEYGAFVDLGPADGLIHVSELDWRYVNHPSEVVAIGDQVDVMVLNVDPERQRIGLSRKRLLPDPWEQVTAQLSLDDVVEGTVTSVASFGLFVDLGGVEGLVHSSRIPGWPQAYGKELVGSRVAVRILSIDQGRQRIGLALDDTPAPDETMDLSSGVTPVGDVLTSIDAQLERLGL